MPQAAPRSLAYLATKELKKSPTCPKVPSLPAQCQGSATFGCKSRGSNHPRGDRTVLSVGLLSTSCLSPYQRGNRSSPVLQYTAAELMELHCRQVSPSATPETMCKYLRRQSRPRLENTVTRSRCGEKYYVRFIGNLAVFPLVKWFWKSIENYRLSYQVDGLYFSLAAHDVVTVTFLRIVVHVLVCIGSSFRIKTEKNYWSEIDAKFGRIVLRRTLEVIKF